MWDLSSDRPIYAQLVEIMEQRIISGGYKCGERLPSVRDLAAEATVNPNTMQKALGELEQKGLIFTQRTSGRFITEDAEKIVEARQKLGMEEITKFLQKMKKLGYTKAETIEFIQGQINMGGNGDD